MWHMKTIGVRELRQKASEHLRRVEAGRRERLVAQGRLVPGSGDLLDLGAPLAPAPGLSAPSEQLRSARA